MLLRSSNSTINLGFIALQLWDQSSSNQFDLHNIHIQGLKMTWKVIEIHLSGGLGKLLVRWTKLGDESDLWELGRNLSKHAEMLMWPLGECFCLTGPWEYVFVIYKEAYSTFKCLISPGYTIGLHKYEHHWGIKQLIIIKHWAFQECLGFIMMI